VPGMPEHFIARMRGLWLSYPDGSVVTAREASTTGPSAPSRRAFPEAESQPPVTDPTVRRLTLAAADESLGARPLVRAHAPDVGIRPAEAPPRPLNRTDCGWLV
jgi:hypothetical protein